MADKLNIPGFKHYELDSIYQAKLAAGEVDPKDLSFVKETGKIYTQEGVYGGGDVETVIVYIPTGGELSETSLSHNAKAYSKLIELMEGSTPFLVYVVDESGTGIYQVVEWNWGGSESNKQVLLTVVIHFLARMCLTVGILSNGNTSVATSPLIYLDTELSDTSENAVQNKAIKAYVDNAISSAITTTLNTAV